MFDEEGVEVFHCDGECKIFKYSETANLLHFSDQLQILFENFYFFLESDLSYRFLLLSDLFGNIEHMIQLGWSFIQIKDFVPWLIIDNVIELLIYMLDS